MQRADSLEKTLMLVKVKGRKKRGYRGWDGWMASWTWGTRVWASSGSWWWTGKPGMLQGCVLPSMGLQRFGLSEWTELNWTRYEEMQGLRSSNLLLKTSNYLKTCPTRFPGAQSASLRPELPQGLLKVNSCSSMAFSLRRGRWQMPLWLGRWQCSG